MPADRAQIQEIKSRLDIVSIISRYVSLTPSGSGFKGKCPFHKDDTPSMTVSQEKGLWHCFGCGAGGDIVAFVMKIENIPFVEAMQRLGREAGVSFEAAPTGQRDEDRAIMTEVAAYFSENLRGNAGKPARDYLLDRGYDQAAWEKFGLGFALPGWDNVKKAFAQYGQPRLIELGLLVRGDKGVYDRFRNRTIFPIPDVQGRPVGFGGRAFEDKPKYLNSPQTPLFDKGRLLYGIQWARDTFAKTRTAILVEGYTDVITLHLAGITNAVGSMGTALTSGQADLMKRHVDEVVIAYDQDSAGSAASLRGMQILRNSGLAVRVATLPIGEDPDGLVRANGADGMYAALDAALPFHRFYVRSLVERHDVTTIRGKEALLNEARGFYRELRSAALREELERQLADLLDLSVESVKRELPRRPAAPRDEAQGAESYEHLGEQEILLALVLRGDVEWKAVEEEVSVDVFTGVNRAIAESLERGATDLAELVGALDEEGARRASFYALAPVQFSDPSRALKDALARLVKWPAIEQRLAELEQALHASEQAQDWKRWDELTREKVRLVAQKLGRKGIHDSDKEEACEEEDA